MAKKLGIGRGHLFTPVVVRVLNNLFHYKNFPRILQLKFQVVCPHKVVSVVVNGQTDMPLQHQSPTVSMYFFVKKVDAVGKVSMCYNALNATARNNAAHACTVVHIRRLRQALSGNNFSYNLIIKSSYTSHREETGHAYSSADNSNSTFQHLNATNAIIKMCEASSRVVPHA